MNRGEKMKCYLCNFDDKKSVGKYIESSLRDDICLNDNGIKAMLCEKKHLEKKDTKKILIVNGYLNSNLR